MKTQISKLPWWTRLTKRMRALGEAAVVHSVVHDDEGLSIESTYANGEVIQGQLKWSEVTSAVVFKRDCITVDLLCIAFGNESGNVEINEEMPEWKNLVAALPRYLPGCMPEETWFPQVAIPAFEPNPVRIFQRHNESGC